MKNKFPILDEVNPIVDVDSNKANDFIVGMRVHSVRRSGYGKSMLTPPSSQKPHMGYIISISATPKSSLRDDSWDDNHQD